MTGPDDFGVGEGRRYRLPKELMIRTVRDETVILDPRSGTYFTLDAVGTRMLALYRETGDIAETARRIVAEYDTDEATARRDLLGLLDDMVAQGLCRIDEC